MYQVVRGFGLNIDHLEILLQSPREKDALNISHLTQIKNTKYSGFLGQ